MARGEPPIDPGQPAIEAGHAMPAAAEPGTFRHWWNAKATRRFRRNPLAIAGLIVVAIFVVVAVAGPYTTTLGRGCLRDLGLTAGTADAFRNPTHPTFWRVLAAPPETCNTIPRIGFARVPATAEESGTILGTTDGGYDIYYGLIWGTRTAFRIGLIVVGISFVIGVLIGSTAAYFGGWIDNLLMRLTDIVIAVPALVLALVIVMVLGNSIDNVMIAIAAVSWPAYARLIRGDILRIKEEDFVSAAQALGRGGFGIVSRHILPNALGPIVIVASLDIGSIVLTAAALSFLGLGAERGYADWGQMISFARSWILGPPGEPFRFWYVSFWPGFIIVMFVLGWNLLGDAFRDVLDPRSNT